MKRVKNTKIKKAKNKLSIVIPILNEEKNILPLTLSLINKIKNIDFEIIFVDDNSLDQTQKILLNLKKDELPSGTLIVSCSKHITVVKNGVLHDTYDCSRRGTRCVYGYWTKPN